MKKSEFEDIIKTIGLLYDYSKNDHVVMNIWQPFTKNGFKLNDVYYNPVVLGKNEVIKLNEKFEKLLKIIKENKFIVRTSFNIENGIISEFQLDIKNEANSVKNLKNDDFEIETDFTSKYSRLKPNDYDSLIPTTTGYSANNNLRRIFESIKLKRHEKELIFKNYEEIFNEIPNPEDWLISLSLHSNDSTFITIAITEKFSSPNKMLSSIFEEKRNEFDAEDYYKMISALCKLKISDISVYNSLNFSFASSIFEQLLENKSDFEKLLKNWEFSYDDGQQFLRTLLTLVKYDAFKQFIYAKNPSKYVFSDWDLQKQVLLRVCFKDASFFSDLIDDGWLQFSNIPEAKILNFISTTSMFSIADLGFSKLLINEFMDAFNSSNSHGRLLSELLTAFENENMQLSDYAQEIIDIVIEKFKFKTIESFMLHDAIIIEYLENFKDFKNKLLEDSEFIQYLVKCDKLDYLPNEIKDFFLF